MLMPSQSTALSYQFADSPSLLRFLNASSSMQRHIVKMQLLQVLLLLAIVSYVCGENHCEHCQPCDYTLCPESTLPVGCIDTPGVMRFSDQCSSDFTYTHIPVTGELLEEILYNVNMLRARVASGKFNTPIAARMPTMFWDLQLAHAAKVMIHQCYSNICVASKKYKYAATTEMSGDVPDPKHIYRDFSDIIIPAWLTDILGCVIDSSNNFTPKESNELCVGHYMPLVQDRGDRIGCAMRYGRAIEISGNATAPNRLFVICNFSRGHLNDAPHYKTGLVPGEGCKTGKHLFYKFLCNVTEPVNPN